ncbi:MAG: hypothetical protein N3G80_01875 [Candidatus Micrarchaeota archaeon]|nr:hypothetical protein [Candidatus Micrarchaeota archaeon]
MGEEEADIFSELKSFLHSSIFGVGTHKLEHKILRYATYTFLSQLFALGLVYYFYSSSIQNSEILFPYLLYTIISSVAVSASSFYHYAHRLSFTCMEGMMAGMTNGMIAGFLFGAITGATNGMFVGSLVGMFVGMAIGLWCGKCCGIMGTLEGLMAGLMAGPMGAMLSVMMLFDNLAIFIPILVFACIIILVAFGYMVRTTAAARTEGKDVGFLPFFLFALFLTLFVHLIVLFGPRSTSVVV